MIGPPTAYATEFRQLIRDQRLDRLDDFLRPLDDFDEPPLYSRLQQLAFLDGLPWERRSRLLIRAAVTQLATIVAHCRPHGVYCMVSIHEWDGYDRVGHDGDGTDDRDHCPRVNIFTTHLRTHPDPADSRTVLDYLPFSEPDSRYARFVAAALDHDPDYLVSQDPPGGESDPWAFRVYVRLGRYWSDHYQTWR